MYDKKEFATHIRNQKQASNHLFLLKKVHVIKLTRVIKFDQETWLKPYLDMKRQLRKMQKMILQEVFSSS